MNYEIDMLNVKAADAFLIHCIKDNGEKNIIMVDAGNYNDADKIINYIRKYYAPTHLSQGYVYIIDTAVVTHPDDDHFGGYVKILEMMLAGTLNDIIIRKFWVNDPTKHGITKEQIKWIRLQTSVEEHLKSVYNCNKDPQKNLLELIDKNKIIRRERFADSNEQVMPMPFQSLIDQIHGMSRLRQPAIYPRIEVIAPTEQYYESLLPDFRNNLNFNEGLAEEEINYKASQDTPTSKSLSPTMDAAADDTSAHNQSSIILLFEPEAGKKYLFMGDSGRDSFNHIPSHLLPRINNVDWMKVQHHGSKRNIDSVIIRHIHPKVAYISTKKYGEWMCRCVVNAFKNIGAKVYSTSQNNSDIVHNQIGFREGWTTIEPM